MVRLALLGSVACTSPPVRFQSSQESIVPSREVVGDRNVAFAQQPLELGTAEVGIEHEPGELSHQRQLTLRRSSSHRRGGATVLPDDRAARLAGARLHATTVSRWLVIPIAVVHAADG